MWIKLTDFFFQMKSVYEQNKQLSLLPEQSLPVNPFSHVQIPVDVSQVPCIGLVQPSGHVISVKKVVNQNIYNANVN